ncbi:Na+/H+ antiporter subunit E [Haloarculaceae archaeon H-GB2-1]|nr:Na+/H+ antiporter subunit E [Haloarculaceae archaeon H-GB1-1]MEA5407785.1 Na+/H+ antiporter subunit E [Haloarculaceae archaeon H-GB2-1]
MTADESDPDPTRIRLVQGGGLRRGATTFGLAAGFYLLLGEVSTFDVLTGAASGLVVAAVLSRVAFVEPPRLRRTLPRVLRGVAFVPYLLWEVLAANAALAVVLVDPRLPIDPGFETVAIDAQSALETAVLANAITLTPGTVTVDASDSTLVVHTLTAGSRKGLREGRLQRAVGFVFRGRETDARAVDR